MRSSWAVRKRALTLIEVMIALAILVSVGGLVTMSAGRLIKRSRFLHVGKILGSEMELTRELSRSVQADMKLTLYCEGGKLLFTRSTEEPLPRFSTLFFDEPRSLGAADTLKWNEEPIDEITLIFSGTGWVFPGGDLEVLRNDVQVEIKLRLDVDLSKKTAVD